MAVRHVPTDSSTSTSMSGHLSGVRPFPLANGDRLTRQEFERRYAARPGIKKARIDRGDGLSAVARAFCRSPENPFLEAPSFTDFGSFEPHYHNLLKTRATGHPGAAVFDA